MQFSAKQIAQIIGGTIEGAPEQSVSGFGGIEQAKEGDITFLSNDGYEEYFYSSSASIIVVKTDFVPKEKPKATLIRVDEPYLAMIKLMKLVDGLKVKTALEIDATSKIADTATLDKEIALGAFSIIGRDSVISKATVIHEHVYVGNNVKIGKNCILYPGVKIYDNCIIGDQCILHSGVVIGADGFGFTPNADGTPNKIPQLGNVVVGNDVEIGANSCIDKATFDSTTIGNGVKIDNLVQIGHNVSVGDNTIICAQVGIAGSTSIGKNCMIAGQVGFTTNIEIADGTQIGAKSGVSKSFKKPNTALLGIPARNYRETVRNFAYINRIGDLMKKVKELEKRLDG